MSCLKFIGEEIAKLEWNIIATSIFIIIFAFIVVVLATMGSVFLFRLISKIDPPARRAGRAGEEFARNIFRKVLTEDDILLSNVNIVYDNKVAEIDDVIINSNGVFIIEVKTYSGTLTGNEEDREWLKSKTSRGGIIYEKQVRNPIKQMKRQIYILSHYLKNKGIDVWIDGYVFFVNNNSPIHNEYILESYNDIDKALHKNTRNKMNHDEIQQINAILSNI